MGAEETSARGPVEWHRVGPAVIPGVEPYPPYERQMFMELSIQAALLVIALDGERAAEQSDFHPKLDYFIRFVQTPLGLTLAVCAGEARRRGPYTWAAFAASLRLPGNGVIQAALAWNRQRKQRLDNPDYWLDFELDQLTPDEADFYDRMIRETTAPGLASLVAVAETLNRKNAAKRKKRHRRNPRAANLFADTIRRDWITEALWCLGSKAILDRYPDFPSQTIETGYHSMRRIDQEISEAGFAGSRCTENEAAILAAVETMRCQLRGPT